MVGRSDKKIFCRTREHYHLSLPSQTVGITDLGSAAQRNREVIQAAVVSGGSALSMLLIPAGVLVRAIYSASSCTGDSGAS